jgi:hypothetical protein
MTPLEKAYKNAGMAASKIVLAELVDEINSIFPRKRYDRIKGDIEYNDYFLYLGVRRLDVDSIEKVLSFCMKYRGSLQVNPNSGYHELIIRIPSRYL